MTSDRDILLTAQGLLRNHGEKAAMECAEMADRWAARGDNDAAEMWRRVMKEIRGLSHQRPN
jgi:hypothetical protein